MTKNAIKAIPILFVLCIIIECLEKFLSPTPDFMSYLTVFSAAMSAFALPLLVFLWDSIKNNSGAGKFGIVLMVLYVVLTIILTFFLKIDTLSSIDSMEKYKTLIKVISVSNKVHSSILVLINGLSYFCIIRLLSRKSADSLIEKVQVVAILSTVLYYGMRLLQVWVSFDYDSIMYKIPYILEYLVKYSIVSFALMQVVDDTPTVEEVASAPAPAQVGSLVNSTGFGTTNMQQNQSGGMSTTPRFRNPALEQQEAMFAQQQAQQAQTAQSQDQTAYNQQYAQQMTYQDSNAYVGQYSQTQYQDPNAYAQTTQYTQQTAYQDQSAMVQQQVYQEQPVMQQTTQTVTQ